MAYYEHDRLELERAEAALSEGRRAVEKLDAWVKQLHTHRDAKDGPSGPQERRAAARRASLDATKAFAQFRKTI